MYRQIIEKIFSGEMTPDKRENTGVLRDLFAPPVQKEKLTFIIDGNTYIYNKTGFLNNVEVFDSEGKSLGTALKAYPETWDLA